MLLSSTIAETLSTQFLFNHHYYLNGYTSSIYFFSDHVKSPSILLSCVESSECNYVSGYRAPFGGIECTDYKMADTFIKNVLNELSKKDARSCVIKQAPTCYQPEVANQLHDALLANGFVEQATEVNQFISINADSDFATRIDAQKRRRLNNAKKMGMRVELFDHIETDDWYTIYTKSRIDKGFPITISKEAYHALSKNISNVYTYAGVFINATLIANAIFVRVNKDVLYYFVAASDPAYAELSPTVLLIEALYDKAVQEKYIQIDLGISSVDGVLNQGLYQFKKHVGAMDCTKTTYKFVF